MRSHGGGSRGCVQFIHPGINAPRFYLNVLECWHTHVGTTLQRSCGAGNTMTETIERQKLRAELESVMSRRGFRSTAQRRLILDRLFEIGGHFTADDLIADVRKADASVGSATV